MNKETFPIWNFLPAMFQIGFSQIAFPKIVLSKNDQVHQWGEVHFSTFFSCFINHFRFVSDFRQVPRRNLFKFLPFCCGYLHCLRHRNKCVCTKLSCCSELSPFPAIWSSWYFGRDSSIRILVDWLASKIHANLDMKSFVLLRVSPCLLFLQVLEKHSWSHWCFQFLASIPSGFFELLVFRVSKINSP